MEICWKDIPGYEGHYQACTDGNIRSVTKSVNTKNGKTAVKKGRVLKQTLRPDGYNCVRLSKENKAKVIQTHRLIALTFVPNPNNNPCINHIDENRTNNVANNLEWCTIAYNNRYGSRLRKASVAMTNGKTSKAVVQLTKDGHFVAEFPSCAEVKRQLGYSASVINKCALHVPYRKTAYGFVWEYKKDYNHNVVEK